MKNVFAVALIVRNVLLANVPRPGYTESGCTALLAARHHRFRGISDGTHWCGAPTRACAIRWHASPQRVGSHGRVCTRLGHPWAGEAQLRQSDSQPADWPVGPTTRAA